MRRLIICRKFVSIICAFAVSILGESTTNLAYAQKDPGCGGYTIAYGNGIMNSEVDYLAGKDALRFLFGSKFDDLPVTYVNAIDHSSNFWGDLMSVLAQEIDAHQDEGLTWESAIEIFLGVNTSAPPTLSRTSSGDHSANL